MEDVSMLSGNWKKQIFTLPNLLSLARLTLIPVYVTLYRRAITPPEHLAAGTVLALSCLTDALDGFIARRFHMVSQVGQVLDPLADKLTQLTLVLCLCGRYPPLIGVLGLFLVKEVFQLAAFAAHLSRGKALPGALPAGKVCTVVLFATLTVLMLLPRVPVGVVRLIALTDCVFLGFSFLSYALAYYGRHPHTRDVTF